MTKHKTGLHLKCFNANSPNVSIVFLQLEFYSPVEDYVAKLSWAYKQKKKKCLY